MPPVYLNDYVADYQKTGEVVFKQRYTVPVLIVSGKAAELVDSSAQRGGGTIVARPPSGAPAKELALLHRVFPIVKSPFSPRGPVLLGRTSDNDVAIPEYSISKRHCMFEFEPGLVKLSDCGSTNGTFLNGTRLPPKRTIELRGGEVIALGRYAFTFQTAAGFLDYVRRLAAAPPR